MSDWSEAVDPGSGNTYYYNAATGETRWEAPEGWGGAADAGAAADAGGGAAASPWSSAVDPGSGRTYYFNSETNETRWDPPPEMAGAAGGDGEGKESDTPRSGGGKSKRPSKAKGSRRSVMVTKKAAKPARELTLEEKLKMRATKFAAQRKREKQLAGGGFKKSAVRPAARSRLPSSASAGAASAGAAEGDAAAAPAADSPAPAAEEAAAAEPALPPNWSAAVDPGSGNTYYYNSETGVTSWELPTE